MNVLTVRRYLIRLRVFSFPPSWIWAFRVRSHSQSQWCPPSKDHFFALNGQNNLWGCFHKRKRMFCRIKASGDWCTTHVWAEEWMKPKTFFSRTTWSMGSSVQGVFRSWGVSELTKYELLSAIVWPAWSEWHGSQLCVRSVVFCWLRKEWSRKGFSHRWPRVWVQVCRRSPGHVVFHSSSFFFCHPPLPDLSHPPFMCFSERLRWFWCERNT